MVCRSNRAKVLEQESLFPRMIQNFWLLQLKGLAVLVVIALKDLFAGLLQDLFGNVSADSVDHNYKSPLYTPDALASSMVRFAPS